LQADIVIVGGGGSGLTAAAAAFENGVKNIIVLEKRAELGGNAVNPIGLLAADSHVQRRLGMDASTDAVFRQAAYYGHWKNNPRLLRALIDKSADTIRWLESKGMEFVDIVTHYPNQFPNTYHSAKGSDGTGRLVVKILKKQCEDAGVRILVKTPAKKILIDKNNRVSGILAQDAKGKEIEIKTSCLIVCTGGFSGNEELIKKYDPTYDEKLIPHRGIGHNGDGILMATEVGADLDGMVVYEWESFFFSSTFLTVLARRPCTMWVNRKGERFCDEGIPVLTEGANAIARQPGKHYYALFDEAMKNSMLADELTPFEVIFVNMQARNRKWSTFVETAVKDLETALSKGEAKASSSIAEIARWMGAKPEVLKASIDEYNSFCDHGRDAIFAKDLRYLQPLGNPPYYALRTGVGLVMTHGGIKVNHRMEGVDKQDEPIPGLYAAGVETGAKDWDSYNMWLSGHSFGYAINGGRIAGEEAAKYVKGGPSSRRKPGRNARSKIRRVK